MFIILFIFAWFVIGAVMDYIEQEKKYLELKQKFDNLKFEHFKLISDGVKDDKDLEDFKKKYYNTVKDYVDLKAKNLDLQRQLIIKRK